MRMTLLIFVAALVSGCGKTVPADDDSNRDAFSLPSDAVNIKNLGKGWCEFDRPGQGKYLCRSWLPGGPGGHRTASAIVKIGN